MQWSTMKKSQIVVGDRELLWFTTGLRRGLAEGKGGGTGGSVRRPTELRDVFRVGRPLGLGLNLVLGILICG
jgi:hypothetical protein